MGQKEPKDYVAEILVWGVGMYLITPRVNRFIDLYSLINQRKF